MATMTRPQLLRLGLFQMAAGGLSVLFLGVLNRIMRVELGLACLVLLTNQLADNACHTVVLENLVDLFPAHFHEAFDRSLLGGGQAFQVFHI